MPFESPPLQISCKVAKDFLILAMLLRLNATSGRRGFADVLLRYTSLGFGGLPLALGSIYEKVSLDHVAKMIGTTLDPVQNGKPKLFTIRTF